MPYEQLPLFSEGASEDVPEDAPFEASGDMPEDLTEDVSEDALVEASTDVLGDVPEDVSEFVPLGVSKDLPEDQPEHMPGDVPRVTAVEAPVGASISADLPAPAREEATSSTPALSVAIEGFGDHLVRRDYAQNTVRSFLGDLHILAEYLEIDRRVGDIGTPELESFLHWLRHERGKPCSPKSYARRLTSLKAFFGWLNETDVLSSDPAAALVHRPVQTPLPRALSDNQLEQVLTVTRSMMDADRPDPRPHLLVSLLVHTGIKKQECMAIKLAHIDASNPAEMVLHVRYENPRNLHKERRLRLPDDWGESLAEYRRIYDPEEYLFPCTARNLEYVLANVAKRASLLDGLSFEMLRWTCAVLDHKTGTDADLRRRKLGLSKTSWTETESKLIRLAEPPL